MNRLFKRKHTPYRILSFLLYSDIGGGSEEFIKSRSLEGVLVLDTAAMQRSLRVTCERFYDYMEFLDQVELISIIEKKYGEMVIKLRPPVGMAYSPDWDSDLPEGQ